MGKYNLLRRRTAAFCTVLCLTAAGSLLVFSVLPSGNFFGRTITSSHTQTKVIALTFDDGPYPPYTEDILITLEKENVHATFFIVGENARRHPQLVSKISSYGHELGLHADKHVDFLKLDSTELRNNISAGKKTLEELSGKKIILARTPHGFKDWLVQRTLKEAELIPVNWSVSPRDWTLPGSDVITEKVCRNAFPGAIVLLHDGDSPKNTGDRSQTVAAVPSIIKKLKAEGYRFVTVSELLAMENI